jgi:hypothetical protein
MKEHRIMIIRSRPDLMNAGPFEDFWSRFVKVIDAADEAKAEDDKSLEFANNSEWLRKTKMEDLKNWMREASKGGD